LLKTSGADGTAAEREPEQVSKVSLGAIDYERYKVGLMRSDIAVAAVLAAGLSQISRSKAYQLQCCSHRLEAHASSDVSRAWIDGLRLGLLRSAHDPSRCVWTHGCSCDDDRADRNGSREKSAHRSARRTTNRGDRCRCGSLAPGPGRAWVKRLHAATLVSYSRFDACKRQCTGAHM